MSNPSDHADNYVVVGSFGSSYGVNGWIKINSATSPTKAIFDYLPWCIEATNGWQPLQVTETQQQHQQLLVLLQGYDSPEAVTQLAGKRIAVLREQLPKTHDNEIYWTDLEGLTVKTVQGIVLGKVDHLFETGANDVLVIEGEKRHLVPYTKSVVTHIDLEVGEITVNWDPDF